LKLFRISLAEREKLAHSLLAKIIGQGIISLTLRPLFNEKNKLTNSLLISLVSLKNEEDKLLKDRMELNLPITFWLGVSTSAGL